MRAQLLAAGIRVILDEREGVSPGFKFNDWEMRGVPLRIEIGPKDVAKKTVVLARRDKPGREGKSFVPQEQVTEAVPALLEAIQKALYERALDFRNQNTAEPEDYDGIQVRGGKGLCFFLVVRRQRMRKKHQGRDQGHAAVHPPGAAGRLRRLHLLRQTRQR